jgi:hypothetical protein
MLELADIFNKYGPAYLEKFEDKIIPGHKQALLDIAGCRTRQAGGHVELCPRCLYLRYFYHSCCNRSCPKCQGITREKWLKKRKAEILPVPYFHIIFTIPGELRQLVRSYAKSLLPIMMRESAYSIKELAADPKFVGGKVSILSVLHTWSRTLGYHPHVHCLVPGGGLSFDNQNWVFARTTFLMPIKKLSRTFRERLEKAFKKEIPQIKQIKFPESVWNKKWVVHCKPAVQGADKIINYLARYVYKIAITNNRIISDHNGKITFKYQDSKSYQWKTMTLDAMEFIRRFLQHVPIKGFHKVRFYGLLSPKNRKTLSQIQAQLEIARGTSKRERKEQLENPAMYMYMGVQNKEDMEAGKLFRFCPKCLTTKMITLIRFPSCRKHFFRGRSPPC